MSTRQRGILVFPMPEEISGPRIFGQFALVMRKDGEMRMVHTEGVAYSVSAERPWSWRDQGLPDIPTFTPAELIHMALQAEPVDLADWVRVFGARLESNFGQVTSWYNEAE